MSDEEPIRLELGAITRLTLDRPDKRNAMSAEMGVALTQAVERVNESPEPRVVIVTGAGQAFSAGGDFSLIDENSRRKPADNHRDMLLFYRSFLAVTRLRVPSIAMVQGAAIGAGLCLAMACDMRFAANEAKLAANFVRVGLHPGMGCTLLLPRLVGPAKAAELILSGRIVTGEEAAAIGLVNRAVPRSELSAMVDAVAQEIAAAAPVAVGEAKATLVAPLLAAIDATLEREATCQANDFTTADIREAVSAFREGRAPSFSGS